MSAPEIAVTDEQLPKQTTVSECTSCHQQHESDSCPIPDAVCWVTSHDPFFSDCAWSNWKRNTVVVACESYAQAVKVHDYALHRGDQQYVNICGTKPRPRGRKLSLHQGWRNNI